MPRQVRQVRKGLKRTLQVLKGVAVGRITPLPIGYVGAPYEGTCLLTHPGRSMAAREGTKAPGISPCPFG
eukprot:843234-Prymnesium_polylepis.1